jgi:hypothetical protein
MADDVPQNKDDVVLKSTLKEVEENLLDLRGEKKYIKDMLRKLKQDINSTEKEELDAAEKLSALVKKELELKKKKDELKAMLIDSVKKSKELEELNKKLKT